MIRDGGARKEMSPAEIAKYAKVKRRDFGMKMIIITGSRIAFGLRDDRSIINCIYPNIGLL